ncbi:hypothetical protein EK904_008667 [Melospiza melodia maxima]|nr:hypothetical protein EK904_008667 [Melospiza melodia maxima]
MLKSNTKHPSVDLDCSSNPQCDPVRSFQHPPGVEEEGTGPPRPPSPVPRPRRSSPSFAGHISNRGITGKGMEITI